LRAIRLRPDGSGWQLYPHEKGDKEHKMRRACEPAHDQVL